MRLHRIETRPAGRRLAARSADGRTLAESDRALVLEETGHRDRVYFPREDVRLDLLAPSARTSHCPFKGDARYWDLDGAGEVAWSYEDPKPEREDIRGMVAFWDGRGIDVGEPEPAAA